MKHSQIMITQCAKSPAIVCLLILTLTGSSIGAISITGVTDTTVYADTATFTVNSEPGWDYTATLNNEPIATDVAIVVDDPEYYRVYVHRINQTTFVEEAAAARFIVRDSSRGNSEWGLPTWTPYPPIDSAAAEFVGAQLKIVTLSQYPMGLEIPVAARVDNVSNERLGVIGDERSSGYESCIATDVNDMYNSYLSVYMRKIFTVNDPCMLTSLTLGISYDDGYIAYINGTEVHSQNPPNPVAYNTPLSTDHEGSCGNVPEYDISAFIGALKSGDNVLAIQIHNKNLTSSDFLLVPAL